MARREIPEINAGSMADIAFLLLIFFLVTTTMDKDQAYIRTIPEISDQKDIPIEERDILKIEANSNNELMIREEIFDDPDKISDFILKFYQTNEKKNVFKNNFPMYSSTSISSCNKEIDFADKNLEEAQQKGLTPFVKTYQNALKQWEDKKSAIQLYTKFTGENSIKEINLQAHIRIIVQNNTPYLILVKIHNEIEEAIFELRDKECNRLFSEQYSILTRRTAQDSKLEDKQKIALLEILYPARIIEVKLEK